MSQLTDDFMKRELYEGYFTLADVEELLEYAIKLEKKTARMESALIRIAESPMNPPVQNIAAKVLMEDVE